MHRVARREPPTKKSSRTNAEVLLAGLGGDGALADLPDLSGSPAPLPHDAAASPSAPPDFASWEAERSAALRAASRPGAVAATALTDEGTPDIGIDLPGGVNVQGRLFDDGGAAPATGEAVDPGLQKRPRDLDLPPWLKGRYGTAVGRAVHGVLQTVDLATGAGLDAAVAAQCQAEAVVDRGDAVRALARQALDAEVVRAAAIAEHWREVYACTPIGDRLLEGYVDLLFRAPDGLVVVDHKTSSTDDPGELDRRVAGYRLQGAAYAVAVGRATAEPVVRVVFLFLTPRGAVERDLEALPEAMAEVERLVAAGQELVTP